jgi:hypothetical protein
MRVLARNIKRKRKKFLTVVLILFTLINLVNEKLYQLTQGIF